MDSAHMAQMMEMHERMMADPVIRERVATDPVLRGMMEAMHGSGNVAPATQSATEEAVDFIVRLLSDPTVEARVHSDPRLHALWSDPEVQRRIAEARSRPATTPSPAAAPAQHIH
jgi:hypothetical protein